MPAWMLADLIVAIHVVYVGFVVLAVPVIALGALLGWEWVRNSWFRNLHVTMIGIVVVEALLGFTCPLTTWESNLRSESGQAAYEGSFIGHWLHELLFVEFDPAVLSAMYCVFGAVVLGLYLFAPPRCMKLFRRSSATT